MKETAKKQLANLLRQAEKAHAEYEKELGERDENWAEWYAGWIIEKLPDSLFK